MGVKHFYYWYSRKYRECIGTVRPFPVDILGLDMNGLFHGCAQKVYRYGNFAGTVPLNQASRQSLLRGRTVRPPRASFTGWGGGGDADQFYRQKLFQEVGRRVQDLVREIRPQTTVLLCVDGVAGLGKMNQQRQRRFRTSQDIRDKASAEQPSTAQDERGDIPPFNPNQFTPGTVLMDQMTRYLDGLVRQLQTTDEHWKTLRVVLSNEKAPGEGEHKIMHYIRRHASPQDRVCIYGMDADLVMLAMLLPTKQVLIARETDYYRHEYIVVSDFIEKVLQELDWGSDAHPYSDGRRGRASEDDQDHATTNRRLQFHPARGIQDFVVLCFLVGNDFLPTIPALSIMDGGLHLMFEVYRGNGRRFGHLTQNQENGRITLGQRSIGHFLDRLAESENELLDSKYNSGATFHHDPIMIRHARRAENGRLHIDLDAVRNDFYPAKFPAEVSIEQICHHYLDGMIWVVNYYRTGIPDWLWHYPFLYGPFLKDLAAAWRTYRPVQFRKHQPVDPFLQLLMVLPPHDQKELVPRPLHFMDKAHLKEYFPDRITIDLSGKKKEWEGIVHIPMIPYEEFLRLYTAAKSAIPEQEARRNIRGRTFLYRHGAAPYTYRSPSITIPQCRSIIEPLVLPN